MEQLSEKRFSYQIEGTVLLLVAGPALMKQFLHAYWYLKKMLVLNNMHNSIQCNDTICIYHLQTRHDINHQSKSGTRQ